MKKCVFTRRRIIITFVTLLLVANANATEEQPHLSLLEQQQLFKRLTIPEAFLGGELSRLAWKEMPALLPHRSIQHEFTRPLQVELVHRINRWQVSIQDKTMSFDSYVASDDRIDSVLLLHNGKIVYQQFKTHGPLERHIAWSVTKVIVAATLAKLEEMNQVKLSKTVEYYLPVFKSSEIGSVKLQDIVDMSSGLDCRDSDGYQNTESCVYLTDMIFDIMPNEDAKYLSIIDTLKLIRRHRPAGELTEYTSANTLILGLIIEKITNLRLSDAISELIWRPMGAEADGLMLVNRDGDAYASGGISARLRDVARFGLLYLKQDEKWPSMSFDHLKSLKVKPEPLFSKQAMANYEQLFDGDAPLYSRWQWDMIWQNGDMYKDGYSGQGIYISPKYNFVAVWFGTSDIASRKHHLLPIIRKLVTSKVLEGI